MRGRSKWYCVFLLIARYSICILIRNIQFHYFWRHHYFRAFCCMCTILYSHIFHVSVHLSSFILCAYAVILCVYVITVCSYVIIFCAYVIIFCAYVIILCAYVKKQEWHFNNAGSVIMRWDEIYYLYQKPQQSQRNRFTHECISSVWEIPEEKKQPAAIYSNSHITFRKKNKTFY